LGSYYIERRNKMENKLRDLILANSLTEKEIQEVIPDPKPSEKSIIFFVIP
jgi:hypothetical protein